MNKLQDNVMIKYSFKKVLKKHWFENQFSLSISSRVTVAVLLQRQPEEMTTEGIVDIEDT